ncbi:hypothetical protein [Sinorhizobium meliloti]|uniref:hypothetical protein n=1 Tax=Rhizobium meliloti TaxID=382 RepID=UPI00299E89B0|nr:hypothetical protein [Sinorhizobium meliloti]
MVIDRTASSTTLAFRAPPKDIQANVKSIVGDPPKPMSTMEIMLAIGQAVAGERERDRWQPMETAPKHGRFLAVVDGEVCVVSCGKTSHLPIEGFCLADQGPEDFDLCKPTVWQPLPEPPGGDE